MIELFIKDLVINGKHGVHPHEKNTLQRFKISVSLSLKGTQPNLTDKLSDTADWSSIRKTIIKVVQSTSFDLMERLTQAISDELLLDKRIEKIEIEISKLDAFDCGVPGVRLVYEQKTL